ncbi:PIN domain-containing protein [Streptomyces sp. BRA346]|uniref:PIN domain-containing protein n=1 Tax=Streptomyces sp. BRA346 TaxID=2878199 RepID=UPI0040645FD5
MSERFLIDNSALQRWRKPKVAEALDPLHEDGVLAVCGPVEMEVMYSARNENDAKRLHWFLAGFDYLPMTDEVWDRAKDVQRQAITKGNHRALSMPDLLIAAAAERHVATVLHYDQDYDMIASITGQPMKWVVEAGTADH